MAKPRTLLAGLAALCLGLFLFPGLISERVPSSAGPSLVATSSPPSFGADRSPSAAFSDTTALTMPCPSPASARRAAPPDPEMEPRVATLFRHLLLLADGELLGADEKSELERRLAASPVLAAEWAAQSDSDDARERRLAACLAAWSQRDFDSAWAWANSREDLIPALAVLASASDPLAASSRAAEWVEQSPETGLYRFDFMSRLWRELGRHEANLAFADALPPEYRAIALQTAFEFYARSAPENALAYARLKTDPAERESALLAVIDGWPEARLADLRRLAPSIQEPQVALVAAHRLRAGRAP